MTHLFNTTLNQYNTKVFVWLSHFSSRLNEDKHELRFSSWHTHTLFVDSTNTYLKSHTITNKKAKDPNRNMSLIDFARCQRKGSSELFQYQPSLQIHCTWPDLPVFHRHLRPGTCCFLYECIWKHPCIRRSSCCTSFNHLAGQYSH